VKPWLQLRSADLHEQRPVEAEDDVHMPHSLAAAIIQDYTTPGQQVLDPFAGYGTTLLAAQELHRQAIGVELLPQRADLIRRRLQDQFQSQLQGRLGCRVEVVTGDARQLTTLVSGLLSGPVDLCLTSPPYMTATGHPDNPLTGYQTRDGDYPTYLAQLGDIFGQVAGSAPSRWPRGDQRRQPHGRRHDHAAGLGPRACRRPASHAAAGVVPVLGPATDRDQR
jgi:hypothetical protein